MKSILIILGIIIAVIVAILLVVLIVILKTTGLYAIDIWVPSYTNDGRSYLELMSGEEWKARFPNGRIVKGTWNYKKRKDHPSYDVYPAIIYYLKDEDGNIYRMEYCTSNEVEDEKIVIFMESGEKMDFERYSDFD